MALSYVEYTGDGSSTQYNVTFPYLSRDHVSVLVANVSVPFSWLSDTLIELDDPAANAAAIKVQRTTPVSARVVGFQRGATLDADADLDTDSNQLIYLIQELSEGAALDVSGAELTATNLADNAVTTPKINAGAVTTAKIADDAVTAAKLADTAVTPGTYTLATITVDQQGRITGATANNSFTTEDAEDAVGGILTDSASIDFTYNDGSNTITAIVKDDSIGANQLADTAVSPGSYTKANLTVDAQGRITSAASGTIALSDLPPTGIPISSWSITAGVFAEAAHGGFYNGYIYIGSKTTSRIHKFDSATGREVSTLTPPLTFGTRCAIKWSPSLAKFICAGSTGFYTLDPATDTFGSGITPTGWGAFYFDYDEAGGFVYYMTVSNRVARCDITGANQSNGGTMGAGACSSVVVAGSYVYALENLNPSASKLWQYQISSWPTIGLSLTLSGDLGYTGGLAYSPTAGKVLVADINGVIKAVTPATNTVSSTITLSGVSGQNTRGIVYIPTTNRVFVGDTAGKLWVLNGTTLSVYLGIVPATAVTEPGFTYDTTNGILAVGNVGGTALQRFYS